MTPRIKRVLSDIPEPKQKSGITGATLNLTNAIVGSGIFGIPFTLNESGLILGAFLLLLVSYLAGELYL
jgi:amino acid permease